MRKFAILLNVYDDEQTCNYKQALTTLSGQIDLLDHDEEVLIVNTEAEQQLITTIMDQVGLEYDCVELIKLPATAQLSPVFDDYGLISHTNNIYMFEHLTATFRFATPNQPYEDEPKQALQQMEEHLLASFEQEEVMYYVIDRNFEELMHGIAKAYGCSIEFKQP